MQMPQFNALVDPSTQDVANAQQQATNAAQNLADTITGVKNAQDAYVREILPEVDLASGSDNGWGGNTREWTQTGLSADTNNEVYQIDSNNEDQDKVLVFYGLANVGASPISTEVSFADGTNATFARLNDQVLEISEVSDYVIFDRPVVYGSTEDGYLYQYANSAGDDTLIYMAKVAEPTGNTVTFRQPAKTRLATQG